MNTAQCTPIQHSPLQSNPIPISHTHVNVMDCAHTHNYMDCAMLAALDHDAGCKMFLFFSQCNLWQNVRQEDLINASTLKAATAALSLAIWQRKTQAASEGNMPRSAETRMELQELA